MSSIHGNKSQKLLLGKSQKEPVVCIVAHRRKKLYPLETFIQNHIERLPTPVKVICGRDNFYDESERPLQTNLMNFLIENKIAAVLAEYGPTGVSIMDSCHNAQVPIIVHFHGFDAYKKTFWENTTKVT
jgi:hypothetical protein